MNTEEPTSVHSLLQQLESVLLRERQALRTLDHDEIESLSESKLQLDGLIRLAASDYEPDERDRELLTKVRFMAQANQLLLVHARNCVQGVIGLFGAPASPTLPGQSEAVPRPVAINIKG